MLAILLNGPFTIDIAKLKNLLRIPLKLKFLETEDYFKQNMMVQNLMQK